MWGFVVPLALLGVFSDSLLPQALYGLVTKGSTVLVGPYIGLWMDKQPRLKVIRLGIAMQATSIVISSVLLSCLLLLFVSPSILFVNSGPTVLFCILVLSALLEEWGTMIMDISVERDWIPKVVPEAELPRVNALMRRIDLITEICSPLLAGLLLIPSTFVGFLVVGLYNFATFGPQYLLLVAVYRTCPELEHKPTEDETAALPNPKQLIQSFRTFTQQPVMLVIIGYALLWLTVLSPHGALLTAFIQESQFFPAEYSGIGLGVFRAFGAIFGVTSTFLFRPVMKRLNLVTASLVFIWIESLGVVGCIITFLIGGTAANYLFLAFILFSRLGLYGFCIGEVQIAQMGISEEHRGAVNSIESALTSLAVMIVYLFGAVMNQISMFKWLVAISAVCVTAGAIVFTAWSRTLNAKRFYEVHEISEDSTAPTSKAHDDEEARVPLTQADSADEDDIDTMS